MPIPKTVKCKHGFLHWVGDGDRRLICKKCDTYFVLIDGKPTKIVSAEESQNDNT